MGCRTSIHLIFSVIFYGVTAVSVLQPLCSFQRSSDSGQQLLDVGLLMVNPESEAQPPVAAVDDDILRRDAPVRVLRAIHVERQEVAARRAGGRYQMMRRGTGAAQGQ